MTLLQAQAIEPTRVQEGPREGREKVVPHADQAFRVVGFPVVSKDGVLKDLIPGRSTSNPACQDIRRGTVG